MDAFAVHPSESWRRNLSRRLREVRNAKGLSQAEIGKRVGVAHTYVSRLEKAHITPTLPLLERLAKGLEIDAYELLSGNEKTKTSKPLPLVLDGAQERSLLRVFRQISRDDTSLLLYMARQMAARSDGASKEAGASHDQTRHVERRRDSAGLNAGIGLDPDRTPTATRVSGGRTSMAAPGWSKPAGGEAAGRVVL